MEGAWDPELGGAKPAFRKSRSRLCEHGTAILRRLPSHDAE
jgi:hypothetical protein